MISGPVYVGPSWPVRADDLVGDHLAVEVEVDLVVIADPDENRDPQRVVGAVDRLHPRRGLRDRDRLVRIDREARGTVWHCVSRNIGTVRIRAAAPAAALAVAGASAQPRTINERSSRIVRRMSRVIGGHPARLYPGVAFS